MFFYNATGLRLRIAHQVYSDFYKTFQNGTFKQSEILLCDTEELFNSPGENFRYLVCNMTNVDHLRGGLSPNTKLIYLDGSDLKEIRSTAEHAAYLALALIKRQTRNWPGSTLYNKTAYIFGNKGRVAKQLIEILEGFKMKTIGSDLEGPDINALRRADFVFMSTSVKPDTKPILTEAILAILKNGTHIINTSRPQVIDYKALESQMLRLGGFASDFDVPWERPFSFNNYIQTEHTAGFTYEDLKATSHIVYNKLMEAIKMEGKNENEEQKTLINKG